jgi:hypothetical protein
LETIVSTARTTALTGLAALAALAALVLTGCEFVTALRADTTPAPVTGPAAALLAALPVAPEDTTAPYDRDQWGDWASHGDGCDTRELVLTEQGHNTMAGKGCRPLCPTTAPTCWVSPYDGAALRDSSRVHIDHRVPLAEAARSGARDWTRAQREAFYNDRTNLVAASVHSNTSKGDDDPGRWQPADRAVWCGYATAYITTKSTYGLSIDPAERDALASMLATCPA